MGEDQANYKPPVRSSCIKKRKKNGSSPSGKRAQKSFAISKRKDGWNGGIFNGKKKRKKIQLNGGKAPGHENEMRVDFRDIKVLFGCFFLERGDNTMIQNEP